VSLNSDHFKNIVRALVPRTLRNGLRSPSRSAEWLWDSTVFALGCTKSLQLLPNWSVVCHPHAYKVIYRAQIADPEQAEEFRAFLTHCSEKMLLFDIGAHFGIFSLAAAHFGARAIAAEPSPTATEMIATQSDLNKCTGRIQIVRAAVSDVDGEMGLLNSGMFSEGYFKVSKGRLKSDLTRTHAMTIDHMVRLFGVPTHIKVDVEGHECAVLRGARNTLREFAPVLFLELHNEMILSEGGDPDASLELLSELGYQTFALSGEAIRRDNILKKPIIRIVANRDSR
jgi:FkbM family methyltransferase